MESDTGETVSAAHLTSVMASSMSLRTICGSPHRWPGSSSQKSFNHLAWARILPAVVQIFGVGCGALNCAVGKNGGTVLGNTISATMPSSYCSVVRLFLSQLRSRELPSGAFLQVSEWVRVSGFPLFKFVVPS